MSLKRKLAATAPAMAMADPNLDYFNAAVDLDNLVDLVAAKPLCATTLTRGIAAADPGVPKVASLFPVLIVDFTPVNTYVVTVEGLTLGFITCTLT